MITATAPLGTRVTCSYTHGTSAKLFSASRIVAVITATALMFIEVPSRSLKLCIPVHVRNVETHVIPLAMLVFICEVVLRCAVGIGHVDISNVT